MKEKILLPESKLGFVVDEVILIASTDCANTFRPSDEWLKKYNFRQNESNWLLQRCSYSFSYRKTDNTWFFSNKGNTFSLGVLGNVEVYHIVNLLLNFLKKDFEERINSSATSSKLERLSKVEDRSRKTNKYEKRTYQTENLGKSLNGNYNLSRALPTMITRKPKYLLG